MDLVTRLRALADDCDCAAHCKAHREAADALDKAEGEWPSMQRAILLGERDALKSKLADAEKQHDGWIKIANNSMLRAEKAEAEAAAYRKTLNEVAFHGAPATPERYLAREALSQPGPGAALLERVKKLEAVAEHVRGMREAHDEYKAYCTNELFKALAALDAPGG